MRWIVATMFLRRFLFLAGLWLVLTGIEIKALAMGAVAVPAATILSLRLLPGPQRLSLWRVVRHLPFFMAKSVSGGFDVAIRALSPRMPIKPGWVEVPARLSGGGRAVMGGELSLMPGTLAAGIRGDRLLVHLLDTDAGFERAIPREEAAIAAMLRGDAQTGRAA